MNRFRSANFFHHFVITNESVQAYLYHSQWRGLVGDGVAWWLGCWTCNLEVLSFLSLTN